MRKRAACVVIALTAALAVSAGPVFAGGGFHKDPDTLVDPGHVTALIGQLLAPDSTIGDTDLTVAGVGADPVGVDLATESFTPSAMSSSGTRFVDNTPLDGDCPQASYVAIQDAVDASGPGDTVKVCPGTYQEQVRIVGHNHDGLKLESLKPLQAVIKWPTIESFPLALVYFNNADGVSVRGFTITGPFTFSPCSTDRHEGLLVDNAFDERIDHNRITNIRNSVPALRGCQEGDAVAIGRRTDPTQMFFVGVNPGSAKVDHNQIDDYQKNGVQAVNTGTSVTVDHNVITGPGFTVQPYAAPNGVVVFRSAAATVDHNIISRNHWRVPLSNAVILDEAPAGSSSVNHNRMFDNDYGVETDTQANLEISHNDIFGNLADAITMCGDLLQGCGPATGIVVRSNDIRNNGGSGITLFGADANLLKSNHIENNGVTPDDMTDGIRVDIFSENNQIVDNHMQGNITHDCHDDSMGGGTAGTANTWQGDRGNTENRAGLCRVN